MAASNLRAIALSALAFALASCGPLLSDSASDQSDYGVAETKDRLSEEQMDELVAGPMATVQDAGLETGEAQFAQLVAAARRDHGPNSVQVADLLTAFGVALYVKGTEPDDEFRRASRRHLAAAIPAYRAAFGPHHPEVAVALNSYADVIQASSPEDPPAQVEFLLEDALAIRLKALGANNPETRATFTQLANLYGRPSALRREPARFAKADAYYRRAIEGASTGPEGDETSNKATIELQLAKLHARSGDTNVALVEARKAIAIADGWPPHRACRLVEQPLRDFAELMAARGYGKQAQTLLPKEGEGPCSRMWRPSPLQRFVAAVLGFLGLGPS